MSAEQDREPVLSQASVPAGAVFLSYASEDVSAAERIASALRSAGIEVWIDKSALRGGDAWDQSIRKQIKACALFIPIISRHAHDRIEGYFRLEWKLAVDRSHLIAPDQAFLLPVTIDDTPQTDERIPDRFRELQWTCLPEGETTPGFIERVQRLLLHEASSARVAAASASRTSTAHASGGPVAPPGRSSKVGLWVAGAVLAAALAYIAVDKLLVSRHSAPPTPPVAPPAQTAAHAAATAANFNPPPHSIAVLPFVNMSGDKDQEYFSDGLTEELLNSLARINELQVAARTSAFSFKGKDVDIGTIARKLNVGAVLEGSVRRSGHKVRVTVQLNNAITGFHLWSQTYDRDLSDVFAVQTDISNAVAGALKVKLLNDQVVTAELGGTRNSAALDAYLRATNAAEGVDAKYDLAIKEFTRALELDPNFALAYVGRANAYSDSAADIAQGNQVVVASAKAHADARKAVDLAPELGLAHAALAYAFESALDFDPASQAYERAVSLEPGNARILSWYGFFQLAMGRSDTGLAALRRAVTLDPVNVGAHNLLGVGLILARHYQEAIEVLNRAHANNPKEWGLSLNIGIADYFLGNYEAALNSCGVSSNFFAQFCLAITFDKLGRHKEAESMLAKLRASRGNGALVLYAWTFAQWGQINRALDSLETAARLRDPWLEQIKTSEFVDPLRKEPRFQAIERELKFPD